MLDVPVRLTACPVLLQKVTLTTPLLMAKMLTFRVPPELTLPMIPLVKTTLPRAGAKTLRMTGTRWGPTTDPLLKFTRRTPLMLPWKLLTLPRLAKMALKYRMFVVWVVTTTRRWVFTSLTLALATRARRLPAQLLLDSVTLNRCLLSL